MKKIVSSFSRGEGTVLIEKEGREGIGEVIEVDMTNFS